MKFRNCLIILDRDGVVNFRSSNLGDYVLSAEQLVLNQDVISMIISIQKTSNKVVVATNQQCIGKKLLTEEALNEIHAKINNVIIRNGGEAIKFYVCPHLISDNCGCRKPKPGLLLQAMSDNDFPKSKTIFVGDSETDRQAALLASVPFVFHSGDSRNTIQKLSNSLVE